jgi:hypothetical protein
MLAFMEKEMGRGHFDPIEPLGWTPNQGLDEDIQRRVMIRLVGRYMGANQQKGRTYEWIPNHLGDAFRRVSPRSFLVAFQRAAGWMAERAASAGVVPLLSPASIEEGVKEASVRRVKELEDDFPWIDEVSRRLEGLLVPCQPYEVLKRLPQCEFRASHARGLRSTEPRVVLDQLLDLGIFLKTRDNRYNVPDLYRVAMNIKRKGGIRLAK